MDRTAIEEQYERARRTYEEIGVNTDDVIERLDRVSLSIHCWQGDDVGGFERPDASLTGGGIQATGNHPGKARTAIELKEDLVQALALIPGRHRVNLHAIYGEFGDTFIDRDAITPEHFQGWVEWAKTHEVKLDFNATLFSHPKAESGFTLSHKDPAIREFWIEHVRRCREISAEMGKQLESPCIHNLWIPDGSKDLPADRMGHRDLLKQSLDAIYSKIYDKQHLKDTVEGKLFGIGSEAFVVGSHEFYLAYTLRNNLILCMDMGHFHPTESVADKISALLPFYEELLLHVSRGVRWDSDHVVIMDDPTIAVMEEIVRAEALQRIHLALDYFDASINRIAAWVIGSRATLKCLLYALLQPHNTLREHEEAGALFQRLALMEELKTLPFGAVWDQFCVTRNVPPGTEWIRVVSEYEREILLKRT